LRLATIGRDLHCNRTLRQFGLAFGFGRGLVERDLLLRRLLLFGKSGALLIRQPPHAQLVE
jgi:hypothetical protein